MKSKVKCYIKWRKLCVSETGRRNKSFTKNSSLEYLFLFVMLIRFCNVLSGIHLGGNIPATNEKD
jgi:hypothetical protein